MIRLPTEKKSKCTETQPKLASVLGIGRRAVRPIACDANGRMEVADLPWTRLVGPGITVIAQPTYDIGQAATELLLQRIAHPPQSVRRRVAPMSGSRRLAPSNPRETLSFRGDSVVPYSRPSCPQRSIRCGMTLNSHC